MMETAGLLALVQAGLLGLWLSGSTYYGRTMGNGSAAFPGNSSGINQGLDHLCLRLPLLSHILTI